MSERRMNKDRKYGKVYLVGAGPGDPELISVRGHRLLQKCDAVLYDALVNPELLELTSSSARRIFVGESRSKDRYTQREINDIMIYEASAGYSVVRLKGGDPFIFGRGCEEIIALNEAGISWEVVPGISAGIAVPAYAGIPLTHRGISSSVAYITGHEFSGKGKTIDIEKLASCADTVVIFMGLNNLKVIAERFLAGGRAPSTPLAIIENGTRADQKITVTTLEKINFLKENFKSPALIVLGRVVALRELVLKSCNETQTDFIHKGNDEELNEVLSGLS